MNELIRTDSPGLVVRVVPEVVGFEKTFDYVVPEKIDSSLIQVGAEVRVRLQGRGVRGWVVEVDADPPKGVELRPITAFRGHGPSSEVVDLAHWAAWRWAGHPVHLLRVASAPTTVRALPPTPTVDPIEVVVPGVPGQQLVDDAIADGVAVVRLAPGVDRFGFIAAAISRVRVQIAEKDPDRARRISVLIVCPSVGAARQLAQRLRRAGFPVALVADDRPGVRLSEQWAQASSGGKVVVGAMSAAWAPAPDLALGIVVDEHEETHQSQRSPTWNARDVLIERCRRWQCPSVLLTPTPTQEALAAGRLLVESRRNERSGWSPIMVLDRRVEDPATRSSLFPPRLAELLRVDGRAVCVLNRTGRTRLLGCRVCEALVRCDVCGAATGTDDDGLLRCPRCASVRPMVCAECGDTALRVLRVGVSRAREELEAVLGEPVFEVSGPAMGDAAEQAALERTRVLIGTEAVLHRVGQAAVVVFLDFDQELTASRYRAGEQALALLARAARMAGPRRRAHRVVVQTRLPDHPAVQAALHADPGLLVQAEAPIREALRLPPTAAMAAVSGKGGPAFVEALEQVPDLQVLGDAEGGWLVRAASHRVLCDALAAVPRPTERLRIEVDPLRV